MATLHATLRRAAGLDAEPQNLSQSIKEATVQLNAFFKQPGAVPALAEMALTAPETEVRQLAALELRKLVNKAKSKTWLKTDGTAREQIKHRLLQTLESSSEPNANVRNGLARVVASIARIEVPQNTWPALLPWIWAQAGSSSSQQKEVGLYTLFALIDTLVDVSAGQSFAQHTPQLYQLLGSTINDEQLSVRVLSVRVLGKMLDYVDASDSQDISTVQAMVPSFVAVCQAALQADDDDAIQKVFDVMDSISLSEAPILSNHLGELIQFLLQAGANLHFSAEGRMAPLNALLFIAKYKKSRIQALNLVPTILQGCLPIGAQEEPEEADEDAPPRVAFRIIDALANALPPATVIDPLIQLCQQYSSSPDAGMRKSAIMAFGVTFEGCSIYIVPHMGQLWPFVEACLSDSDAGVRKAACITMTFMCDMIGDECAKHHAALLPRLTELVNHEFTRRNALNALDSLLEVLGKDIIPYLPALMNSLLALLPQGDIVLKAAAVGAIGSAAHASKAEFAPFFPQSMQQLVPFLQLTEEGEQIELRGVTQDTVGTLAEAVGKDAFSPYFESVMHNAFAGCATESASLRECSFIYFAVMSRVYKQEFAPFLPNIVPLLLASLGQDDKSQNAALLAAAGGFDSRTETPQPSTSATVSEDFEDDAFEDLDEEELEEALLGVNSAVTHEKETAANALAELFENVGTSFLPYIEKSVQAFLELIENFNENLRKAGMEAALNFISSGHKLLKTQDAAPKWTPSANPAPVNPDVKRLIDAVVPKVLIAWDEEDDRDVVTSLCDTFSEVLLEVGPAVVAPSHLEHICKLCLDILEKRSICQQDDDEADVAPDAEQSEWDAHLIRGASDLVSSLAIAIGPDFAPAFQSFFTPLSHYADAKRQPSERAAAVGACAECINGLQHGVTPYTEQLFTVLMAGLNDNDLDVRSNAAFATGSLVFQSTKDLSSQYMTILTALARLFDRTTDSNDTNQACDNACGAVARLLLKNADALPLDQVLPAYLGCLPIRLDFVENGKVFESLISLLQSGRANGQESAIFNIMGQALQAQKAAEEDSKPLQPDTLLKVIELLKSLPADQLQNTGLAAFVQ